MKRKNGFTLIELLAIIVILAIIAVITVPIILNIIENSKQGAVKDSAYGYKDAVNKWYVSKLQDDSNYTLDGDYTIEDGKIDDIEIPLSGEKPTNGYLSYDNNLLIGGCLTIGEYKVTFDEKGSVSSVENGLCEGTQKKVNYYTYDSVGNKSDIYDDVDPSWNVWVKKKTPSVGKGYGLAEEDNGEIHYVSYFTSASECSDELNATYTSEEIEEWHVSCNEVKISEICELYEENSEYEICGSYEENSEYEICGKENGKSFCLKPNDYENSVDVLEKIFESEECSIKDNLFSIGQAYYCESSDVSVSVSLEGYVTISNYFIEISFLDDDRPIYKDSGK